MFILSLLLLQLSQIHSAGDSTNSLSLNDIYKPAKTSEVLNIGVVSNDSLFTYSSQRTINSNFEIGSVTKVFTAFVIYKAIKDSLCKLNDPIEKFLPLESAPIVTQKITIRELLTHSSGLERIDMSIVYKFWNASNPYEHYSYESLLNYLQNASVGEKKYNYSNTGYMILGLILEKIYNKQLNAIFREKIVDEFHLKYTTFEIDSSLVNSYDFFNFEINHWTGEAVQAAGLLKSNIDDLFAFLRIIMNNKHQFQEFLTPISTVTDSTMIGYGWHFKVMNGDTMIWHNGGTYGFSSFIGFYSVKQKGVVVLSNNSVAPATETGVEILNRIANYNSKKLPDRSWFSKINPADMKYFIWSVVLIEILLVFYII